MEQLLNVTGGLSVLLLTLVLVSVRRAHIRVEYSFSWLIAAGALLVLSRNGSFLRAIARLLGIQDAPVALLLIAASIFLLMFFRFSMIISDLRDDNIALAQRLAILEYHVHSAGTDAH